MATDDEENVRNHYRLSINLQALDMLEETSHYT